MATEPARSQLLERSAALWLDVPGPTDGCHPSRPARVGPLVPTAEFIGLVNRGRWEALASLWPALDANQRVTVLYSFTEMPLPPGYSQPVGEITDWLLGLLLADRRAGILSRTRVSAGQWQRLWDDPVALLPAELRHTPATAWLTSSAAVPSERNAVRLAILASSACPSLPFAFVHALAQPLTARSAEAVAAHPDATPAALVTASRLTDLPPGARARLAAHPAFPAAKVPPLFPTFDEELIDPLLGTQLTPARLVALLEQPWQRDVRDLLVLSQPATEHLLTRLDAPEAVLAAVFTAIDVDEVDRVRQAALACWRPGARAALARTSRDPAVLATLAADSDLGVRAAAAERVMGALAASGQGRL